MSATTPALKTSGAVAPARPPHHRITFLRWLRKVHGWIGLWGAVLGLLFGFTGILMNHRAVLKISLAQTQESNLQLRLPDPAPASADALAQWLQSQLALDRPATRVREEPARPVAWGDKTLTQPAHWMASFATPRMNVQADWWVGNDYVSVKRSDGNLFAALNNLHKGVGMSVGWILLVDTLGGSIILLSLSGVILWSQLHPRRLVGALIAAGSLVLTVCLAAQGL
jgi:hypothetical protein